MISRGLCLAFGVLFVASLDFVFSQQALGSPKAMSASKVSIQRMPADYSLLSLDDGKPFIHAASLKGKTYILQFWASWCRSCGGLGEVLEGVIEDTKREVGKTPLYIAASLDENIEDAQKAVSQAPKVAKHAKFSFDPKKTLAESIAVVSVPTILLINAEGHIVLRKEGHLTKGDVLELKKSLKDNIK